MLKFVLYTSKWLSNSGLVWIFTAKKINNVTFEKTVSKYLNDFTYRTRNNSKYWPN